MDLLLLLRHLDPRSLVFISHLPPDFTHDSRDIPVVILDVLRYLLLADKVAAEKDEGIAGTWYVAGRLFLCVRLLGGIDGDVSGDGEGAGGYVCVSRLTSPAGR